MKGKGKVNRKGRGAFFGMAWTISAVLAWIGAPESVRGQEAAGASPPMENEVFDLIEVAPGVHAALVKDDPAAYAFANSLVVIGEEGVLVVDTQQSPTAARALLDEIRALTDRPVRWVVNTHWHGDHVYGNQVYADAFPGVHFLAHEATRAGVLDEGAEYREGELSSLPASIEERRGWLESGRGPTGEPLSEADRAAVERSVELRTAYLRDLRGLRPTPPDVTFTDRLTVHVGGRRVELIHPGRAHTRGDVVVYLPDAGVLAAGDLLEEGPPWLEGSDVPSWARALERVADLEVEHLLPSHGTLHDDRSLLDWQTAFFGELVQVAERAVGEEWSMERTVAHFDAEAYREAFAGVGLEGERYEAYVRQAVKRAMDDVAP